LRFASYKKEKALSLFALLEPVRFPFSFRRRRRVPGTMMCAMMCFEEERARALFFVSQKFFSPAFCVKERRRSLFLFFFDREVRGARASDANERCADSRDFARFYGSDDEQPSVRVHRKRERQKKKKNERNG
jgi:hypothetical protein